MGAGALVGAVGIAALLTLAFSCSGCLSRPGPGPVADHPPSPSVHVGEEPQLRIRIARSEARMNVSGQGSRAVLVQPHPDREGHSPLRFDGAAEIQRRGGAFTIRSSDGGQGFRWGIDALEVYTRSGDLQYDGGTYPGRFVLVARGDDRFDVVNYVDIETYLPGVLASELYSHWHLEAYRAQAIAARSYALVQAERRRGRDFDLENTQASQVYAGATANRRALEAARDTRGLVLAHEGVIVTAYYSSCTGPLGQDAATVFRNERDVAPLRGRNHVTWAAHSPHRQWGPIQRPLGPFSRRIAAWGESVGHEVGRVATVRSIEVATRNEAGRPGVYRLIDSDGRRFELHAEQLRLAANHTDDSLPALSAGQRLKSGDVEVRIQGDLVRIRGRGFGHGVGLSQHGAQAMATHGYGYQQILSQYYPEARVVRSY